MVRAVWVCQHLDGLLILRAFQVKATATLPTLEPCWRSVCGVDVGPAVDWLAAGSFSFPSPSTPDKPQRIFAPPASIIAPIVARVLHALAAPVVAHEPMLSRVRPGQEHGMHVDVQRSDWVTRIHVPLTSNPGCWFAWEAEGGRKVHFDVGQAYTFDTSARHAFANEGLTDRVHLIFDVLRKDG